MSDLSDFEWQVLRKLNDGDLGTIPADEIFEAVDALSALIRNHFVTKSVKPNVTSYFITEAGKQALALRDGTKH